MAAELASLRTRDGAVVRHLQPAMLDLEPRDLYRVIAYGLAGTMDFDFDTQPLGQDPQGNDVFLRDIWPTERDVQTTIDASIERMKAAEMYGRGYRHKLTPTDYSFQPLFVKTISQASYVMRELYPENKFFVQEVFEDGKVSRLS